MLASSSRLLKPRPASASYGILAFTSLAALLLAMSALLPWSWHVRLHQSYPATSFTTSASSSSSSPPSSTPPLWSASEVLERCTLQSPSSSSPSNPSFASSPSVASAAECTLVLLKPDALERGLVAQLLQRLHGHPSGWKLVYSVQLTAPTALVAQHYAELVSRTFYPELEAYMTRGPVAVLVWTGPDAVAAMRALVGPTDPRAAPRGTLRGDLAADVSENLVHASATRSEAAAEIALWLAPPVQALSSPLLIE